MKRQSMRSWIAVALLAVLPALAATPVSAHVRDESTGIVDTATCAALAPRDGVPRVGGFGRLSADALIECSGCCDTSNAM